jgi:hypothetical protein
MDKKNNSLCFFIVKLSVYSNYQDLFISYLYINTESQVNSSGMSFSEISKVTGLSESEIEKL